MMQQPRKRRKQLKYTVRETSGGSGRSFQVPLLKVQSLNDQTSHEEERAIPPVPELPQEQEEKLVEENAESAQYKNSWSEIQHDFVHVFLEDVCHDEQECVSCHGPISEEHIKCNDCGAASYYCSQQCCIALHRWDLNPFHKPLQLKKINNGKFKYIECFMNIQFKRPSHQCITQRLRYGIQVYDHLGRMHNVSVVTCKCEKEAITMFRYGLWSSTIDKPSILFHTELLDTAEFLMLEGKISLHAFCQSLRWRNDLTAEQCSTLYTRLRGEPIGQYRFFKHQIRSTYTVSSEERISNCLACPKDGNIFISLDANFGLVRKKGSSAGTYLATPNHGTRMFWRHQMLSHLPQVQVIR
ncbi:uncharacterized protein [Amphiura filiformis]|uniref:uncharacterized protein n=1 Tax=Amphiura filiformis TaxID=82378 RepID=UPI003B215134